MFAQLNAIDYKERNFDENILLYSLQKYQKYPKLHTSENKNSILLSSVKKFNDVVANAICAILSSKFSNMNSAQISSLQSWANGKCKC